MYIRRSSSGLRRFGISVMPKQRDFKHCSRRSIAAGAVTFGLTQK